MRIAFPSGLARSYLDVLFSFDYPLRVLIPFKIMLNMKTDYIGHVLLLEKKCVSSNRSMVREPP